jgi:hypothetical protein
MRIETLHHRFVYSLCGGNLMVSAAQHTYQKIEAQHLLRLEDFVETENSALRTNDREAIAAVNGAVGFGLERHASFLAAASADGSEILTGTTSSVLAGIAAGLAALGLILEATLSIELLLTGGEHEFLPTFFANQSLVLIHC